MLEKCRAIEIIFWLYFFVWSVDFIYINFIEMGTGLMIGMAGMMAGGMVGLYYSIDNMIAA